MFKYIVIHDVDGYVYPEYALEDAVTFNTEKDVREFIDEQMAHYNYELSHFSVFVRYIPVSAGYKFEKVNEN